MKVVKPCVGKHVGYEVYLTDAAKALDTTVELGNYRYREIESF